MKHRRSPYAIFLMLIVVALSCHPGGASAAPDKAARVALVIANAAYADADSPLPTPIADARALSEELKREGFAVALVQNATKEAMTAAIDRFASTVEPEGTALVFFSGYGIQASGQNYLIPVDAHIWNEADVMRDGVSLDALRDDLVKRRAAPSAIILDASRRTPYERRFRNTAMGLAPAETSAGELVLFATGAGGLIKEDKLQHGLFVTVLIRQLATIANRPLHEALSQTSAEVSAQTKAAQVPAFYRAP